MPYGTAFIAEDSDLLTRTTWVDARLAHRQVKRVSFEAEKAAKFVKEYGSSCVVG